jgi:hypothetical protein
MHIPDVLQRDETIWLDDYGLIEFWAKFKNQFEGIAWRYLISWITLREVWRA